MADSITDREEAPLTLIPRRPLRDDVYRELLTRIYRGDLAPGRRVRDTALATELGVSRTPVREALLRLSREGLVECDLGRGFSIRAFSATEAGDIASILSSLECLGLRESDVFPDERLNALDAVNAEMEARKGDPDQCLALNDEWHQTLLEGCSNRRLRDMIVSLKEVARRYVVAYMRDVGRVEMATHDHAAITAALRTGSRVDAERLLAEHWKTGIAELQAWIAHSTQAPGPREVQL